MKVAVWDTFVPLRNEKEMHFDIMVEEKTSADEVYSFGRSYLNKKGLENAPLSTKECKFCHVEVAPEHVVSQIASKGFAIVELENCDLPN